MSQSPRTSPGRDQADLLERASRYLIDYSRGTGFFPMVIVEGRGTVLRDLAGREYLDFGSGQMCATIGHNHPRMVEALRRSAERVLHLDARLLGAATILLAERLAALLPWPLEKAVFLSTGAEANEMALKLARMATGRYEIVGLVRSFHGLTAGTLQATFNYRRTNTGPGAPGYYAMPAPYCYRCPLGLTFPACSFQCLTLGFQLVDAQSSGSLAAVIAEPILSSGGIIEPPPGYFHELRRMAVEREMLLILDEAQTGLGRVGAWFAFQQDGVVPDLLALSKTLGGGVPISATVTSADIEERARARGFGHITSHVSDPMPSEVALAVLDALEQEGLVAQAAERGAYLKAQLQALQARHEIIGDVRGRGLLLGVEFVRDRATKAPATAEGLAITAACRERGLLVHPQQVRDLSFSWRVAPPLTVSTEEIDRAVAIVDEAITTVLARQPIAH
ncbi:MAG: aspartate aminotransferase family protein [Chloroflexi bacterium]|nr:aspartate aminotransferase family protein [Chloroflexota bacterium]